MCLGAGKSHQAMAGKERVQTRGMLLVRFDPGGDFGVEDVKGKGAVGEDFVVEGAEVEFVAELPASLFAEFEEF